MGGRECLNVFMEPGEPSLLLLSKGQGFDPDKGGNPEASFPA